MAERNDPKTGPIDGSILDMIDALNAEADRLIERRHPDDVLVLRLLALTNALLVRLHNRIDVVMDADKHLYERIERGHRAEELEGALRELLAEGGPLGDPVSRGKAQTRARAALALSPQNCPKCGTRAVAGRQGSMLCDACHWVGTAADLINYDPL